MLLYIYDVMLQRGAGGFPKSDIYQIWHEKWEGGIEQKVNNGDKTRKGERSLNLYVDSNKLDGVGPVDNRPSTN